MAFAFASGLIAVVYRGILAYEPVMSWWWRFGNRFEDKWFFKPVWGCELCISGQMALWFYTLLHILPILATHSGRISAFAGNVAQCTQSAVGLLFGLLIAICGAIFTAKLLYPFTQPKN